MTYFARGTRVLMRNGLYKSIEDIKIGDETMFGNVINIKSKPADMIKFYYNNWYTPTVCTKDICVKNNNDYGLLTSSNTLVNLPSSSCKQLPKIITPTDVDLLKYPYEFGYFLGLYIGYGTCNENVIFRFGPNENLLEQIQEILEKMFGATVEVSKKNDIYQISTQSKFLIYIVQEFGNKIQRRIPQKYWVNDLDFLSGIFDGLIDEDPDLKILRCVTTSREMAEFFVWLASMINVEFTTEGVMGTNVFPIVIVNRENVPDIDLRETTQQGWSLTINGEVLVINNLYISTKLDTETLGESM